MDKTNKNSKNKKNKSVAKKTAVKKVVKKVTKNKRKLNAAAPSNAGRPRLELNFPKNVKFSLDSWFNRLKQKVTKVTLAKRIHEALNSRKPVIKLVDKKIIHSSGRGQPMRFFKVVAA